MVYLVLQKNGMGNQMFAYAYARYLQECYCQRDGTEKLTINADCFINGVQDEHADPRHLSLNHFYLNPNTLYLNPEEQAEFKKTRRRQLLRAMGLWDSILLKVFHKKKTGEAAFIKYARKGIYYSYHSREYYQTVLCSEKNKYVSGHFQDMRYFDSIRSILKEEFRIKTPASVENQAMLQRLQTCNGVCLHVRRGDYLNPYWAKLNICDEAYYQKAVEEILNTVEDPVFFVFSNTSKDLEWIRENYHFVNPKTGKSVPMEYVDLSNPDYEEFRLMRACKHFIIPNSTFSWWAAYLADEDSVVCAPDRWDLTIPGDAEMNCPGWRIIPTGK